MATPAEILQVRALVGDTTMEDYDATGVLRYAMSNESLESFLDAREGALYGSAADALRAMAAMEIRIGKVLKTQDLSTDGAKVGDALRLLAREYDRIQRENDDDEALEEFAFEIVNFKYVYINPEDTYRFGGF